MKSKATSSIYPFTLIPRTLILLNLILVVNFTRAAVTVTITSHTNTSCSGYSDGTATATASGGTAPYTYSWSPAGGSAAVGTSMAAGTYTCTVHDAIGLAGTATVIITSPVPLTGPPTVVNVSCYGGNNGTSHINATGGTAPYTYSWYGGGTITSGQGTSTISGLTQSWYVCSLSDSHGCSATCSTTVSQPSAALIASLTSTNETCYGGANATATATASGGTPGYTYSWVPSGATIASPTNLTAGTYTCNLTDYNGCLYSSTVTITQPFKITDTMASKTNVLCNGANTGMASVSIIYGTSPYTYSWMPGRTSDTLGNITAGTYTCHVTDNAGCTVAFTQTITQPPAIVPNPVVQNVSCNGFCDGKIKLLVTGGTTPYYYSWSNASQPVDSAFGLCQGSYTVAIIDSNGCNKSTPLNISQPAILAINHVSFGSGCGICNGQVTTSPTGGTAPYVYSWFPGSMTTPNLTALCGGIYSCTVTDSKGCAQQDSANISQPVSPVIKGTVTAQISGAVNSGWVYLVDYSVVHQRQMIVDSVALTAGGKYIFSNSIGGQFLVYAEANIGTYPNTLRTYSLQADKWTSAAIINAACAVTDTGVNINMYEILPTTGSGTLSGLVKQGPGYVARMIPGHPVILAPGDPVPGLDVNLEQHPGGIIVSHTTTGSLGGYTFANVPPGTYDIFVDIPGLGMTSAYTRTVSGSSTYTNLNYRVDSTHIYPDSVATGILDPLISHNQNSMSVSPNPFHEQLNIQYSIEEDGVVYLELFDMLGEKVAESVHQHLSTGTYTYSISKAECNLVPGVYFLKANIGTQQLIQKVINLR